MEVRVKYELLSKATISCISYTPQSNILAVVSDGIDTALFYAPSPGLSFAPRFAGESKPPASGYISWSSNGAMVAVFNVKVELWKFENMRFAPLRIISEGYVEIKNMAWAPDSQCYLCYGISPKDQPLSVNIRNIDNNELRQIIVEDLTVMANFDPFGKYICIMSARNVLDLYDARSLHKHKSINLFDTKVDIPTLRQRRIGDWSPEYSFLAVPNLNDSKVPTAVIFDRNRNFVTKQILIGHQVSISCLRFNPQVYEFGQQITFILAVGDSSGCLSLWRIGKSQVYKEPLFIVSSPAKAEESIDSIEWNNEGDMLFVNYLKRYIGVFGFRSGDFGKRLTEADKSSLIIATYGASGASEITGQRLQVFGQADLSFRDQLEATGPKVVHSSQFDAAQKPKQRLIKTEQKVITNKGEKKRIVPSRYVPESEINQMKSEQAPQVVMNNGAGQLLEKPKMPVLKLTPLKSQPKKQYFLSKGNKLQVQNSKNVYILSLRSVQNQSRQSSPRFFAGELRHLTITKSHILLINQEKLFIFDHELGPCELPCYLGDVCSLAVNNQGTVFYMLTNGLIRGLNYLRHEFLLETSIGYLLLSSEQAEFNINPVSMFMVYDDDRERLHVQVRSTLQRYFYSREENAWYEFNFLEGFYLPGHSLRVTAADKANAENFYMNLVAPAIAPQQQTNTNKIQSTLSTYEMQLMYYKNYVKDTNKYRDALLRLISDLKNRQKDGELRKIITKYFVDRNSGEYIGDPEVWDKVRRIGGQVIEEFLLLGQF